MAFPVVEATATSTQAASTSHTVSLPAGIVAGETLIVLFTVRGAPTITFPAGWTIFFDVINDIDAGNLVRQAAAWRKADGLEGGSITVTTSTSLRSAHNAYRISGATDPTVTAPQASAGLIGTDAAPDPDTLTPTGGAKDYLWLAVFGGQNNDVAATPPTSYTDLIEATLALGPTTGSARRNLNAASEDPGTFTIEFSMPWVAETIAVHPSAAAVGPTANSLMMMGAGT